MATKKSIKPNDQAATERELDEKEYRFIKEWGLFIGPRRIVNEEYRIFIDLLQKAGLIENRGDGFLRQKPDPCETCEKNPCKTCEHNRKNQSNRIAEAAKELGTCVHS